MSLKQEIETWVAALAAYDHNEFDSALHCFKQIADTSKILFNCGVIHATLGEHSRAVECYQRAVQLDQYLAIAYFQQGVSNFLMGDFEEALANFNDTLLYLRGNTHIDYEQLGLKFKLYSCEVLFNRGLCYIYLQQKSAGLQDLIFASKEKMVPDHDVIDEAIKEQADGYTVFSIPVGVVYRPNEAKVKNLKQKNYLGMARLVANRDQYGGDPRRQATLAAMGLDDRPGEKLSYAALNLVRPDLKSRSRQQSEPPLKRQVFPPTPPPEELVRPDSAQGRRKSSESMQSERSNLSSLQQARPAAKPLRLELGVAAFEYQRTATERPRPVTRRAESERPAYRREYNSASIRSNDSGRRQRSQHHSDVPQVRIEEDPIEAYSEQAMLPQQQQQQQIHHHRSRSSAHRSQPLPIEEENEDEDEASDTSPTSATTTSTTTTTSHPLAFEIIPPKPLAINTSRKPLPPAPAPSPPAVLKKLRVKVHGEDMRYVMASPDVTYAGLEELIRAKFGFKDKGAFKLKMRDEDGDMVTMADQDDLDMAVAACRAETGDGESMGKMEVWVQEI